MVRKGVNQHYADLSKMLFGSRVTLILFLDANFALFCIEMQIGFPMNFNCILFFPNVPQRKIAFSTNFSRRFDFPGIILIGNHRFVGKMVRFFLLQ